MIKATMVLEGGATRGVFTSGVLDYLMEQDLYPQDPVTVWIMCRSSREGQETV